MEQNYISNNVIEQIKDFTHYYLNEEQKLLIDKLIPNEELKQCYKLSGLCKGCKQPKTSDIWCQSCNSRRFQQNFKNWTSGNSDVDKLIQESQLNAKNNCGVLGWIEYDRFEDFEYITKGGFGEAPSRHPVEHPAAGRAPSQHPPAGRAHSPRLVEHLEAVAGGGSAKIQPSGVN